MVNFFRRLLCPEGEAISNSGIPRGWQQISNLRTLVYSFSFIIICQTQNKLVNDQERGENRLETAGSSHFTRERTANKVAGYRDC